MTTQPPPPFPAETGDTLPPDTPLLKGQFRIEGFLNSGGFGVTYLARDSLERRIVIKECFPSTMCCRAGVRVRARSGAYQSEFDAVVRLFGQEARRLAKLDHPNIVGVRDVFEENGTAYMAIDYVEGRDLEDIVDKETWRLDPQTVRDLTVALLDAIGHVHARGMLHRDISPDNVLLTHDDTPILIDFGAARDTARRASRVLSTLHVVKDGYSPQEFYLAAGEQTPASDLYSLAATLYRVITGTTPVHAHSRLASIAEREKDPYLPLVGTADGYDERFLRMIDKALSVFPRNRPQSAAEWMAGIAGTHVDAPGAADDGDIAERIRRLVEATNIEVRRIQEERAREQAERERLEAQRRLAEEAARKRRLEEARREAEAAERAYRERQRQEEEARAAREAGALQSGVPAGPAGVLRPAPGGYVEGAGGVNRARLLHEREERRRRALAEAEAAAAAAQGSGAALSLFGGGRRPSKRISKPEGQGS